MTRAASWTNPDGLVVGFGRNTPNLAGNATVNDRQGVKTALTYFTAADINAAATVGGVINVPVPLGARIVNVRVVCHTAWTSTGTNTFSVGLTGGDVDAFLTTTVGTIANMTAGAVLNGDGVSLFGATDTAAAELYTFTAADTIDLVSAQVDWLTGTASLVVDYV